MGVNALHPLSFRSYGADGVMHRHDHVQLVLPVVGNLEIEIDGRGGRLDTGRAAFVAPGADHVQSAEGPNRFLIVDCDQADLGEAAVERLSRQVFMPISPAARRLIEFVDLSGGGMSSTTAWRCTPLLLEALLDVPQAPSRLEILRRRIEMEPGLDWSVSAMAQAAGVSPSRLHALFRAELDQTPHQMLSEIRLRAVQEGLTGSTASIAELAFRTGYSDQSALTRAMRRATGLTPGAYRKRRQQ